MPHAPYTSLLDTDDMFQSMNRCIQYLHAAYEDNNEREIRLWAMAVKHWAAMIEERTEQDMLTTLEECYT